MPENSEFKCKLCQQSFFGIRYLKRHINTSHKVPTIIKYNETCKLCKKSFRSKTAYLSHQRREHSVRSTTVTKKSVDCRLCPGQFTTHSSLNRHIRTMHKNISPQPREYERERFSLKCLEVDDGNCDCSFRTAKDLIQHLKYHHNKDIVIENLIFSNNEEFLEWKNDIEESHVCRYIVHQANMPCSNGKKTEYLCNRSGKYKNRVSNPNERKRKLKSKGSCKINTACISRLEVIETTKKLHVKWIKTHYGHSLDVQHLRLSKVDRETIINNLSIGASTGEILDKTNLGRLPTRRYLLNAQDIRNIKRSYGLEIGKTDNSCTNETITVDKWVSECLKSPQNPVLFYKRESDESKFLDVNDFCLITMNSYQEAMLRRFGSNIIILDSIRASKSSFNFDLTVLMVVTELSKEFPVAVMFSNRNDLIMYQFFFQCIKDRLNVDLLPTNIVFSEINSDLVDSWTCVYGAPENYLYAPWFVDRDWEINLNLIEDKVIKDQTLSKLKILQNSLDLENFLNQLDKFTIELLSNNQTVNFGNYFQLNYVQFPEKWAKAYWQLYNITNNLNIESFHQQVSYFRVDGRHMKTLDKALHTINKYVKDCIVGRISGNVNGDNSLKKRNIIRRHRFAKMCAYTLQEYKDNANKFQVIVTDTKCYNVMRQLLKPCCKIVCEICNICLHSFTCECSDYTLKTNLCKHIHFVVMHKQQQFEEPHENSTDDNNILDELAEKTRTINQLIRFELSDLNTMIQERQQVLDFEIANQVKTYVNEIRSLVALPSTLIKLENQ